MSNNAFAIPIANKVRLRSISRLPGCSYWTGRPAELRTSSGSLFLESWPLAVGDLTMAARVPGVMFYTIYDRPDQTRSYVEGIRDGARHPSS